MAIPSNITRRTAIVGALFSTAALATPVVASASADAHLFSLVEAWRAQYDDCTKERPQAATDDAYDRLYAIERELAAVRPITAEGYAAKLLILTSFGEFEYFDGRDAELLLSEARAIANVVPPRSFIEQREAIAAPPS